MSSTRATEGGQKNMTDLHHLLEEDIVDPGPDRDPGTRGVKNPEVLPIGKLMEHSLTIKHQIQQQQHRLTLNRYTISIR